MTGGRDGRQSTDKWVTSDRRMCQHRPARRGLHCSSSRCFSSFRDGRPRCSRRFAGRSVPGGLTADASSKWRGVNDGLLHGILVCALGIDAILGLALLAAVRCWVRWRRS